MEARRPCLKPTYFSVIAFFVALLPSIMSVAHERNKTVDECIVRLKLPDAVGPESLAFDRFGNGPYTGVSNGRILKWQGVKLGWTEFAYNSMHRGRDCKGSTSEAMESKCGRPLGLQFHNATGKLYIADASFGLLSVGPKGGLVKVLATEARGVPFKFTNGLDVDQETGFVYFTDSSNHITRRDHDQVVISNDTTGRLVKYNPRTKKLSVLKSRLTYPNGLTVSHDGTHLLICFTSLFQIHKYWIKGSQTGRFELFADLPGYPDNIKRNPRGEYWVAMVPKRHEDPDNDVPVAFKLNQEGLILEALNGDDSTSISEVNEIHGSLWIGSVTNPFVAVCSA